MGDGSGGCGRWEMLGEEEAEEQAGFMAEILTLSEFRQVPI